MSSDPELSKNARKRLLKAEKYASIKAERRARDKEKKRLRAELKKADTETTQPDRKKRKVQGPRRVFNARIVVDLGFDDLMSEKEVVSLCSQLAYTYSSNRHSCNPFSSILCTSLNGKTLARLHELQDQHTRWNHVQFLENGYETLWSSPEDKDEQSINIPKETIVYLTGDSEEELLELKEGETYIIGGICDHNRYKNLCLNKAQGQAIRHARLPIGTYLQGLPTRKILTVNQVFDILLQWVEHRDWEKAFLAVMPKRKFNQSTKKEETSVQLEEIESDQASEVDVKLESNDPTAKQPTLDDVHQEAPSNPELS